MADVIDLSEVNRIMDDPANKDRFALAERLGRAVRAHFKGRRTRPELVIDAACAALQAALRELPEEERAQTFKDLHDRFDWFEEFLAGIGRPAEGEA